MTECERLLSSGFISEGFLAEETREEYPVSNKQKKVWAVCLDLLVQFQRVCDKHGLRWYLMCGSLLGAIRHKGFIPWDDDIDVAMPREDYEKLQTLKGEFRHPYFLQTPATDPGYFYSFIKIRNTDTACIVKAFENQGFNQGIMLDIFCVDKWLPEEGREVYAQIGKLIVDNSTYMRRTMSDPTEADLQRISQYSGRDPMENYNDIVSLSQTFRSTDAEYVCLATQQFYAYEKNVYHAEDFADTVLVPFEKDFAFPVPCGYERILRTLYGDWTQYPPVEKRGTWHNGIMDPDRSYLQY